ncbi:MAG: TIGR02266 family protein [Oligoflexales bacterium]|nr:TIGR02266 family protein [Oligoflexales bacterium]
MASKVKSKKGSTKEKVAKNQKSETTENRTSGTRIPIQLLVDYKADGNYLFDFCKDLGEGGVFIETKNPKKQGSELELTFTIPDSKQTLSTKGKVIWVQQPIEGRQDLTPGMGIQFEAFNANDRKTLEEFVRRYSSHISKSAS